MRAARSSDFINLVHPFPVERESLAICLIAAFVQGSIRRSGRDVISDVGKHGGDGRVLIVDGAATSSAGDRFDSEVSRVRVYSVKCVLRADCCVDYTLMHR